MKRDGPKASASGRGREASEGPKESKGIILPLAEYEKNAAFFDAVGATFRREASREIGFLAFPPGTTSWSCPVIQFPNKASAVVVIAGRTEDRRVITGVLDARLGDEPD